MMTMQIGAVIMAEAAALSASDRASRCCLGAMVNLGYPFFSLTHTFLRSWTMYLLVVFGANVAGDGLRDALDPRLRGTICVYDWNKFGNDY
jgi:ABC-type dipeptide/oligopeptide/nickel transport system permease subunit